VISASAGDEVIGFISVRDEEKTGSLWVMGGYVLRECRRQGIYTKLWQRVIEYAKEYQAWKLKQVA
jgi:GNAT superfamily N-acetyltransferase